MADATVLGRFLWHELMSVEPKASQAFYPKVVGWKTQPWEQNANYTLWVAKSGPVGGVMQLPESARAAGAKTHWLPYIGAPNIEATVSASTQLGALVVVQVSQIPNGGRYAVLADPQGAMFGLYSAPDAKAPGTAKLGEFSWHELAAADYRSAFDFYQKVFGWERTGEHDMGSMGVYFMFGLGGVPMGGIFNKPANMPAHWMNYALVADAAKAGQAAVEAGGQVINGPMEVPGGDWITQILDPQGAAFAVHAHGKAAASPPTPKTEVNPARKKAKAIAEKAKPKAKAKSAVKAKSAKKPAKKKLARRPPTKKSHRKAGKSAAKKHMTRKPATKQKAAGKKKAARKK